jgi:hypothetical protein
MWLISSLVVGFLVGSRVLVCRTNFPFTEVELEGENRVKAVVAFFPDCGGQIKPMWDGFHQLGCISVWLGTYLVVGSSYLVVV